MDARVRGVMSYKKGQAYEVQIRDTLLQENKKVYLWSDIPFDVFVESGMFKSYADKLKFKRSLLGEDKHNVPDTGCDIYYFNEARQEWLIAQCKNYTGAIPLDKMAGFYMLLLATKLNGELFYTSRLTNPNTMYKINQLTYSRTEYNEPENILNVQKPYTKLIPYNYQLEAIEALKDKSRAILSIPCGMGKTLIMIKIAELYDVVIIFSPLRAHAQQNLLRFRQELGDDYEYVLVDSDGIRDVDVLRDKIKEKAVLSSTYRSSDVINSLLEFIPTDKSVCILVDEFHNLNQDHIFNNETSFNKIFTSTSITTRTNFKYLFVSATPRIFDSDEENYVDSELITGKVEYTYSFGKAIQDGHICDYDVFVPDITITNNDIMADAYKYLNDSNSSEIDDIDNIECIDNSNLKYDARANFLLRCMDEQGHKKCIAYSKSIEDAKELMDAIERMRIYHILNLYTGLIIAGIKKEERNHILDEFSTTTNLAIICSVRILDECIDIPKCDSVFLSNSQSNKIRTIQRICRANRKDKDRPDKKSGVYMWVDEYDEMAELVANLKEFDESFTNEKIKICDIRECSDRCVEPKNIENEEKYKKLYDVVLGIKRVPTWNEKLDRTEIFILENHRKPSAHSENKEEAQIAIWLYNQYRLITPNNPNYGKWEEFKQRHSVHFNKKYKWFMRLDNVKQYIHENGFRPSKSSSDKKTKKLAEWTGTQIQCEKNRKELMQDDDIYIAWTTFVQDNFEHFCSNIDRWYDTRDNVDKYITTKKSLPLASSQDKNTRSMALWISKQKLDFKKHTGAMALDEIRAAWCLFNTKHIDYLLGDDERWFLNLDDVKVTLYTTGLKPSLHSENERIIKQCRWLNKQQSKFKFKRGLFKKENICKAWEEFIIEYPSYFFTEEQKWNQTLEEVDKFIIEKGYKPSHNCEDLKGEQLSSWLRIQEANIRRNKGIIKNQELRIKYDNLKLKHKKVFLTYEDKWERKKVKLQTYIDEKGEKPFQSSEDPKVRKLAIWLKTQLKTYKTRECIMEKENIRRQWEEFIEKNPNHFKKHNLALPTP